jgi:ubiquinone/menaquinone biosynthesis C-methylase UbiE
MTKKYESYGDWWGERAKRAKKGDMLQSVIDPGDIRGGKNSFIDFTQKTVLSKYFVNTGNILDFGCGTGRFLLWLSSRASLVVGIDVTEEMLAQAKENVRNLKNVELWLCECTHLPFRDESFDDILDVAVLQVLILAKEDAEKAAEEMVRTLKVGGRAYVIEQVSKTRRIPENYMKMFKGCRCIVQKPILRGKGSKIIALAERRIIPKSAFPLFARLELLLAKYSFRRSPLLFDGYYFFIFRKVAA